MYGGTCIVDVNYEPWPFLLLTKRYNMYKALACSTTFFQQSLFCTSFFQLRTFKLFISSNTSSQRVLGLPVGLLDMGFHLLIFCTLLYSAMRSTWPTQVKILLKNQSLWLKGLFVSSVKESDT